jgi:hypothetical protein
MNAYLIAHKVRGQPVFDVAEKMQCPICKGVGHAHGAEDNYEGPPCVNCEGEGHWWILSTIGHRAYPYYTIPVAELMQCFKGGFKEEVTALVPDPPEGLRDFYAIHDRQVKQAAEMQLTPAAKQNAEDLLAKLGLI